MKAEVYLWALANPAFRQRLWELEDNLETI